MKRKYKHVRHTWSDIEKFLYHVDKTCANGCWEWEGWKVQGYGKFIHPKLKKIVSAHRWSYEYFKGQIPSDLVIDHICRNRACVNPEHLRLVTNAENILIGFGIAAENARKTHCKRGHELIGSNLHVYQGGRRNNKRRVCRACARIKSRKEYKMRKLLRKSVEKSL